MYHLQMPHILGYTYMIYTYTINFYNCIVLLFFIDSESLISSPLLNLEMHLCI